MGRGYLPTAEERMAQHSAYLRRQGRPVLADDIDRMIESLREIASEGCTYAGHGDDKATMDDDGHHVELEADEYDPDCPGEVCWAKKALR